MSTSRIPERAPPGCCCGSSPRACVRPSCACGSRRSCAATSSSPGPAATATGCGATLTLSLGGTRDPGRFAPIELTGRIRSLSTGEARLETMRVPIDAGPTAVLEAGPITLVILSKPAFLFDRAVFWANGCDPRDFDLVVIKSPHCEPHMFDARVARNLNVDAPGSTSADLSTLGHRVCARPIFPLEPDTIFAAAVERLARW